MLAELQNTIANLVQHLQSQLQIPPEPIKPPKPVVIQLGLNGDVVKELFKKVYSFSNLYKL